MDTLTAAQDTTASNGMALEQFLPPESPMAMSEQPLRRFERQADPAPSAASQFAGKAVAPKSIWLRRACIFIGTAAMTAAGCYEMYQVLQVGGVTLLEWMVLVLFVLLFAWVAFSFMSALAGFFVLLLRKPDPLGIDPKAPLPAIRSRNAMLLPTYNEDPYRILARLRAICESVEGAGSAAQFDWFVLSDTTDPAIWIAEEKAFVALSSVRLRFSTVTAPKTPRANPVISRTGSSGSARAMNA
jgi:membrane glycosyltransferase